RTAHPGCRRGRLLTQPQMHGILIGRRHEDRLSGARLRRRRRVGEPVPAVIAFHALAAGRDDFRSADSKAAAVAVAPVAVDGVGEGGARQHRQSKRGGEKFKSMANHGACPRTLWMLNPLSAILLKVCVPRHVLPLPPPCLTRKIPCPPSARRPALS